MTGCRMSQKAPGVMYSMLSLVKRHSQRKEERLSGFPARVGQPAALRGILGDAAPGCDTALSDAS